MMVSRFLGGDNLSKYQGSLADKLQQARNEELKMMQRAVDNIQNMGTHGNKRIIPNIITGELDKDNVWKNNEPYKVEISDEAFALYFEKKAVPGVDASLEPATLPELSSMDSAHYTWTKENGITEKMTIEEEIALRKENAAKAVGNDLSGSISQTIGKILQPYDTLEEAEKALYQEVGSGTWISYDEDYNLVYQMNKNGEQFGGLFGQLANHLNNYLEVFGKDNDYFAKLDSALNQIDNGQNSLIKQIRNMLNTVANGEKIDTGSAEYQEDVTRAVTEYFDMTVPSKNAYVKKNDKHNGPQQTKGLSFEELEMFSLKEDKKLLDEMLGTDKESKPDNMREYLLNKSMNNLAEQAKTDSKLLRRLNSEDAETPQLIHREIEMETANTLHPVDEDDKLQQVTLAASWHQIAMENGWETEEMVM